MRRRLPILLAVLATLVAVGAGVGVNEALARFLALPEGAEAPAVADASQPERPDPRAERRTAAGPERSLSKRQYIDGILGRNIFDPDAIGQDSQSAGGNSEESLTDLNVTLVGTVVASPDRYSSALIADEDGATKGYGIGDKLMDATVLQIETTKVTLERGNGDKEVLTMDDDGAKPRRRTASRDDGDDEEGIDQVGDNSYVVDRELVDRYMGNLDMLARMGRAIPHRGTDGQIDGYRLSGIRRNTMGEKIGIKNGDIVHSVNGHPLTSMQGAMAAYQALQSESDFEFEVTRRGQRMNLEYEIR